MHAIETYLNISLLHPKNIKYKILNSRNRNEANVIIPPSDSH
jgi:hypothetical protein